MSPRRVGFTLTEIIVVLTVMMIFAGMLAPVLQIAQRTAKRTNTLALLGKVEAGIRHFKEDVGTFPFQAHVGPSFPMADNRLAYHLIHTLTSAERTALFNDAGTTAGKYDAGVHRFIKTTPSVVAAQVDLSMTPSVAMALNRMGRERARIMIYAGCSEVKGVDANTATPLLTSASPSLGWGSDYLRNDIPVRNIKGDAIVDSYGTPLLYVCPVVCRLQDTWVAPNIMPTYPRATLVYAERFGFQGSGRVVTDILASDMRTTAARSFTNTFELWSLGADKRADPMRNNVLNNDNISAAPYLKGLK